MATQLTDPFEPDFVAPPGDTIQDLLDEQEMTQTDLAQRLGVSTKHLNQVVRGTAPISPEMSLGLEKVFSVPARFWLTRESLYRSHAARESEHKNLEEAAAWTRKFPINELKRRHLLPQDSQGAQLTSDLLRFLGVAGPDDWAEATVAYRRSQKTQSDSYAVASWLRVGELEAREIECEPFDPERFREVLGEIRGLTRADVSIWQHELVELCADAGVAVVIVDAFDKAKVNGATRWLTPRKALIQLSLRYSWEDIFWFSFFHEAGHVLLHQKKCIFLEPKKRPTVSTDSDRVLADLEDEADRFAARTLIPPPKDKRLADVTRLRDVELFANSLGISPAIVVGRLQREGLLPYSHGNKLRRRLKFTEK